MPSRVIAAEAMTATATSHDGGIQWLAPHHSSTVIAAAHVPFAPSAMAWAGNPELQHRLLEAVRRATAPIFLLQAQNDYHLGPSEALGGELSRRGPPNRAVVYPPYGRTQQAAHGAFALRGTRVWGADVRAFLDEVLLPGSASS